jgi:hypothetical protein
MRLAGALSKVGLRGPGAGDPNPATPLIDDRARLKELREALGAIVRPMELEMSRPKGMLLERPSRKTDEP